MSRATSDWNVSFLKSSSLFEGSSASIVHHVPAGKNALSATSRRFDGCMVCTTHFIGAKPHILVTIFPRCWCCIIFTSYFIIMLLRSLCRFQCLTLRLWIQVELGELCRNDGQTFIETRHSKAVVHSINHINNAIDEQRPSPLFFFSSSKRLFVWLQGRYRDRNHDDRREKVKGCVGLSKLGTNRAKILHQINRQDKQKLFIWETSD